VRNPQNSTRSGHETNATNSCGGGYQERQNGGTIGREECASPRTRTNGPLCAVKVTIKTRQVTVEGPRGTLKKDLGHLAVSFQQPDASTIKIEMHHGARKNVAALRTVRSLVNNMIIGVTKGFKYKMRYVYAHFPINVNLDKDNDTGLWVVEIRYGTLGHLEGRNNVKI
jgi:hypothetical protein